MIPFWFHVTHSDRQTQSQWFLKMFWFHLKLFRWLKLILVKSTFSSFYIDYDQFYIKFLLFISFALSKNLEALSFFLFCVSSCSSFFFFFFLQAQYWIDKKNRLLSFLPYVLLARSIFFSQNILCSDFIFLATFQII